MTNEQTDTGIRQMGMLTATEHNITGSGPVTHYSTHHAGDVGIEVFTDAGVWVAADSEDVAQASTGIKLTPEGARRLAGLLEDAADELDDTE